MVFMASGLFRTRWATWSVMLREKQVRVFMVCHCRPVGAGPVVAWVTGGDFRPFWLHALVQKARIAIKKRVNGLAVGHRWGR